MTILHTTNNLTELISTLSLIQLSYGFSLLTITCQWLGHKQKISKSMANGMRLLNFSISVPVLTLIMINYVFQYCAFFLNQSPVIAFLILILAPAGVVYVVTLLYKNSAQGVLGCLMVTLLFYAVLMGVQFNGLRLFPSLFILTSIYMFAIATVYFAGIQPYDVLHGLSQRVKARFKSYDLFTSALHAYDNKSHLVLNIVCGLSFSMLNFVQVYQHCTTLGSNAGVTLIIVTGSLLLKALLACEFIHVAKDVKYHYNFVIQTYINLYVSLQRLWFQTRIGVCGSVSLSHGLMVLILALVNTPSAFAMDDSESTGLSHKRSSAGDCPSMGLGDSEGLQQQGEPVAEGTVKKAAKVAFDGAKMAAEKVKPHVEDMVHRVVETAKNNVAGAAVGGTSAAVGTYVGAYMGSPAEPEQTQEQLESTVAHQATELAETKQALAEANQALRAKDQVLRATEQSLAETKKALAESQQTLEQEKEKKQELTERLEQLQEKAAETNAHLQKITKT